jgi:hypothetical protein
VETRPARRLRGFDLLALGAGADAFRALEHARIPVLIARWLPVAADLTGTILVPVDCSGTPESSRAVGSSVLALPE